MAGTSPAGAVGVAHRRAPAAPSLLRWTLLCALAEAAGMTAAAGAARLPQTSLALVVAAGLVEGSALGAAQVSVLGRWLPGFKRIRYVAVTVLVAGLGWAAAAAPSTLSGDDGGTTPPLALVLLGAAGLGVVMGSVLGAVQAAALRGAVPHPWRWVGANVAAWPVAMMVIFVGATSAGPDWPLWQVLVTALATGAVAGAALGIVTGWFLPSLTGQPARNRALLHLLTSPWRTRMRHRFVGLEVYGRRTGHTYRFPVQFAADVFGLVVVPGRAGRKTWWTNLERPGTAVEVLWDGHWLPGRAELLRPGDAGYEDARSTYEERWPAAGLPADQVVVRICDGSARHS